MITSIKQWMNDQNEWVKNIDPRLRVSKSDCRIGCKFAIVIDKDGYTRLLTEFMTRQEWNVFRGTINICGEDSFKKGLLPFMR